MIELSVIIPSFNTKDLLFNCLSSIYQETIKVEFEVIIVDNGSVDGSVAMVKNKFPDIKIIKNKKNLGYAKANNKGIKQAKGKYILFLNSDTVILNNAIEKSLNFMQTGENIDILGCKLLNKDKTLQPSGGFLPNFRQIFYTMFFINETPVLKKLIRPYQQNRLSFYNKTHKWGWATAAFLLVKKDVLINIGGFDEDFFMYAEEVEFCFRAAKAGFKCWYYPKAEVIHLKGRSSKNSFENSVLGEYRGLKKIYKKYKSVWQTLMLRLILKSGAMLRIIIFAILKGEEYKRRVYEKAFKLA